MTEFNKILKLAADERVELAESFKETIGKELVLGMTRYVCRYGTLSDGHEKITDAQRYYQAIKQMWSLQEGLNMAKANAMLAEADLRDAESELEKAEKDTDKLRAEAKIILAKQRLMTLLVSFEDGIRQLDEFNKVRLELMPIVRAKYPEGIEQAEPDNWRAVAEYRMLKQKTPGLGAERLDNVPMSPEAKLKFGSVHGRLDAIAPALIRNKELIENKYNGNADLFIKDQKLLENK